MARPNIHSILSAQANAMKRVDAENDAHLLEQIAKSISPKGPISAPIDISNRIIVKSPPDGSTKRALDLVKDLVKVLHPAARKVVLADLGRIADFLERHTDMPLSALLAGLASNDDIVGSYADRMKPLIGHDGFERILSEAIKDKRLKQPLFVKLAAALGSKVTASTSKKKISEQLLQLHNSLATFRAKKRAMAGRSAA